MRENIKKMYIYNIKKTYYNTYQLSLVMPNYNPKFT